MSAAPEVTVVHTRVQQPDQACGMRIHHRPLLIVGPSLAGVPSTGGWWTQYLDCLDVSNHGTASGSKVHIWTCHGGTNQKWTRT